MSEVLEGIICKSDISVDASELTDLDLVVEPFGDFQIILESNGARAFSESMSEFAQNLSSVCDSVLLFRYDSRVGYRYSSIFENGELKREFTEQDEIYVLLDESGYPRTGGVKFTFGELDELSDDEEYETYKNAIELGLENIGLAVEWGKIKEKIYCL